MKPWSTMLIQSLKEHGARERSLQRRLQKAYDGIAEGKRDWIYPISLKKLADIHARVASIYDGELALALPLHEAECLRVAAFEAKERAKKEAERKEAERAKHASEDDWKDGWQ